MARNFSMSDAEMLQQSNVKREHFLNNKADFVNFDPDFDLPFENDWLTSIETSEALPTDESRDDVVQQETEDVDEAMDTARATVAEVKYFANKVFKTEPDVLGEIGFNDYDTSAATQQGMATFLGRMHKTINEKYNAQFLGVNFSQLKIDNILTVKNNLKTQNNEQDVMVQTTPEATKARETQLNNTFAFWQSVNAASKALYRNNLTKLNLFLFPHGTEDPEIESITGTVRDNENKLLQLILVSIAALGVTVLTDSNGQYLLGGLPPGTYTIAFSKTGYQTVTQQVTVTAAGVVVVDAVMIPV